MEVLSDSAAMELLGKFDAFCATSPGKDPLEGPLPSDADLFGSEPETAPKSPVVGEEPVTNDALLGSQEDVAPTEIDPRSPAITVKHWSPMPAHLCVDNQLGLPTPSGSPASMQDPTSTASPVNETWTTYLAHSYSTSPHM